MDKSWCAYILILSFLIVKPYAKIIVTENSSSRFSFIWECDSVATRNVIVEGNQATDVSFEGANCVLGGPGEPVIPAYSFYIGVPASSEVTAKFDVLEYSQIKLDAALRTHQTDITIIENSEPHFGSPWISNTSYRWFRGLRTARFFLRPVIYDPLNLHLKIARRGICTIDFSSPSSSISGSAFSIKSDYMHFLASFVLNFDIAQRWIEPSKFLGRRHSKALFPLAPAQGKILRFRKTAESLTINEASIYGNGIVKIKGSDILAHLGENININRLAMYGSLIGDLPYETPAADSIPDGLVEIPLMRFDLNGNSSFDKEDYLLAYVSGSADWQANQYLSEYTFVSSRYDWYRHYWIVYRNTEAASVKKFSQSSEQPSRTLRYLQTYAMFKRSTGAYQKQPVVTWPWVRLSNASVLSRRFNYTLDLPRLVADSAGLIFIDIEQSPYGSKQFSIFFSDSLTICNSSSCYFNKEKWYQIPAGRWGNQTITITADFSGTIMTADSNYIDLDKIAVKYTQKLDFSNLNPISVTLFSPFDSAIVRYSLEGLPKEKVYIFRIPPKEFNIELIDTVISSSGSYSWIDTAGKGIKYYLCTESGFKPLPELTLLSSHAPTSGELISNLRDNFNKADFLIISHELFLDQALRLANHKRKIKGFANPRVVCVDDVYREFSGGRTDPAAIRNFLVYVKNFWLPGATPDYVILMGNGHFDYRNIGSNEPNFIPPFEYGSGSSQRCLDDFFSYLDKGEGPAKTSSTPDIFLGRIPCISVSEASAVVDKIIETEDPSIADFGAWRNRILLVADDDMQGVRPDRITDHHISSEKVLDIIENLQPALDVRKIYLYDYETDPQNYSKPEASRALEYMINDVGVAYVNFFGHGADRVWSDEAILHIEYNLPLLNNTRRYPVISSFSCTVGRFDLPGESCLSDALVTKASSGAIAAVSSTRNASADANTTLAKEFYRKLFDPAVKRSIGAAYAAAKAISATSNSQLYCYLGDPSIQFTNNTHNVELEIYNSENVRLDTLKALQRVIVRGKLNKHGSNVLDSSFGSAESQAYVQLGLFNPPYLARRKDGGKDTMVIYIGDNTYRIDTLQYPLPGAAVFIGRVRINKGQFQQSILLPRRLAFGKKGAKLTAYAWSANYCGTGIKDNLVFQGTDTSAHISDEQGPQISIRPIFEKTSGGVYAYQADKLKVSLPLTIAIEVFDSTGIDITGSGPDEGLTVEIQGVLSKRNINHKFNFTEGDFRSGTATIALEKNMAAAGIYNFNVTAQDLLGNITLKRFILEIVSDTSLSLNRLFNYPNPMTTSTRFFFYPSYTSREWGEVPVRVTLRIYTLSGKLLKTFPDAVNGQPWDGTDEWGNRLSPNIYLYQATAFFPQQNKTVKSDIQKLVIRPAK